MHHGHVVDRAEFSTRPDLRAIYLRSDDGRIVALSPRMDADIKEKFTAVRAELRAGFAAVRAEIRGSSATLPQDIREEGVATRRHVDIVAETLRDDIRIIAEGLIALDAKVERMRS